MSLTLSKLRPSSGSTHKTKRVGRGNGSGMGTYSCRGQKGQGSRTGKKFKSWFEGGQTSFLQKMPKLKGFTNPNYVEYKAVNLKLIEEKYSENEEVTPESLVLKKIIKSKNLKYAILGEGTLNKKINISTYKISKKAKEIVEKNGGKVTIIGVKAVKAKKKVTKK